MKILLTGYIVILLCFFVTNAHAQFNYQSGSIRSQNNSITFWGGFNAAGMSVSSEAEESIASKSYQSIGGFHVGATYNYFIKENNNSEFILESGLILENKGSKKTLEESSLSLDRTFRLYYLDVPVYFNYRYRLNNRHKVYIGVGPYVGVGIFGNKHISFAFGDDDPSTNNQKIKWGSNVEEDDLKRLDYGLSGKVGYLFNETVNVAISYDYGLPNISTKSDTESFKNRLLRISLAYTLRLKP